MADCIINAECSITLFGEPEVIVDGKPVKLGVALPLLTVLILQRNRRAIDMGDVVDWLNRDSEAEDPASCIRKRKRELQAKLRLELPKGQSLAEMAQAIAALARVDVVRFDAQIGSVDSQLVREAVALRQRGPLLASWQEPDLVASERAGREKQYQTALWRLIQEDRHANPKEAVHSIDLLLACPDLPEKSVEVLREQRLTLEHELFRDEPGTEGSKTTAVAPLLKLPASPTELIGREADLDAIQQLLFAPGLVTLTGTGGIGKTRLAIALAYRLRENFPYGAGFADLTTVSDAAQLTQQIGQSLGLMEEKGRPWRDSLLAFLEDKTLLLVWDNCEHLVPDCAALAADILARCPGVRLLATSREPLRAYGERRYQVPTLLPPGATELFLSRAQAVRAGFGLTAENSPAISQICRDLDGLPLALELAASLVDIRTVEQIAKSLQQRFDLLSDGPRAAAARHRSLRAAFDVSYDLLLPAEQTYFAASASSRAASAPRPYPPCPPTRTVLRKTFPPYCPNSSASHWSSPNRRAKKCATACWLLCVSMPRIVFGNIGNGMKPPVCTVNFICGWLRKQNQNSEGQSRNSGWIGWKPSMTILGRRWHGGQMKRLCISPVLCFTSGWGEAMHKKDESGLNEMQMTRPPYPMKFMLRR